MIVRGLVVKGPETYVQLRKKMHELVQDGSILEAVETTARYHGIDEFRIIRNFRARTTAGVAVYDTFSTSSARTTGGPKPLLEIGMGQIRELEKNLKHYAKEVENQIEEAMSHEGGHHKPATRHEIIKRQKRMGRDPYGWKATRVRESQAEIYSVIKCHEERTLEELLDVASTKYWLSLVSLRDEIEAIPEPVRDETVEGYVRSRVYLIQMNYAPFEKREWLDRIVGHVMDKYKSEEWKNRPKSVWSKRDARGPLHKKVWKKLLSQSHFIESVLPELKDKVADGMIKGYARIIGARMGLEPEAVEDVVGYVAGKYRTGWPEAESGKNRTLNDF